MCKLLLRCVIVKKKFEIIASNNNVEKKLINKVIKAYLCIYSLYIWSQLRIIFIEINVEQK